MHEQARDLIAAEVSFHMKRRDELSDKIRFGLVGLNGASLLALISALGGEGQAATWLGFTQQNAQIAAASFTVGLVLAGYSLFSQQNASGKETSDAYVKAEAIIRLIALHKNQHTPENLKTVQDVADEFFALPTAGFQYRIRTILAQHFAAAAWLIGISVPLTSVLDLARYLP